MIKAEWLAELLKLFPTEILGYKRPEGGVPTDLEFSTYFPEFIAKDGVGKARINAVLRQVLSNDACLYAFIDALRNSLTQEDFKIVTTLMKGLMTPEMLKKLNGIADKANNYSHPTGAGNNHIPSGGAAGQVLKWLSNGVARWVDEYSYTHPSASGNKHIPSGGSNNKILRWAADGTAQWGDDVNTWRGIVNALNSISTTDSLSAAQGKWLNDNKANTVNAALTGTPTAPTPATADNSTKIATTAFVLNLINNLKASGGLGGTAGESLQPNGWVKFTNGLIIQWGYGGVGNHTFTRLNFPIMFNAVFNCLAVGVNTAAQWGSTNSCFAIGSLNTTGITIMKGDVGYGAYFIAIGK